MPTLDPAVNGEGDIVCVAVLDEHPELRSSSIKAQRLSIVASRSKRHRAKNAELNNLFRLQAQQRSLRQSLHATCYINTGCTVCQLLLQV